MTSGTSVKRVLKLSRVWKGILGIRDLSKIRCGNRENDKHLDGCGIWLLPGKRDSRKFGHGMRVFFRLFVGNSGNRHDPNKRFSWPKSLVPLFKPSYRICLVNTFVIETVREYFVSTRCQKCPRGVIAYQLLTPCSIDSVTQALHWSSLSSKIHIYCNLDGSFPQLIR